ncbi:hypothetical protein D3C81_1589100 [compost metagenome]
MQVGLGLAHLGAGDVVFRRQSGHPFFRNKSWFAQGLSTVEVQLGAPQGGLVGGDLGLTGGNQAGLLGQAAFGLQALGFAGGEGGAGAFYGQAEIVRLKAHQQIALGHMLVVLNQDFIDARAELAGNPGDFTLYISVVGALVEASFDIPVGEKGEGDEQNQGQENQQAAFELSGHGVLSFQKCKQI